MRTNAFHLRRRILGIQAAAHALLLELLGELQDVAVDPEVVFGNPDLVLRAAKLDIVARQFR